MLILKSRDKVVLYFKLAYSDDSMKLHITREGSKICGVTISFSMDHIYVVNSYCTKIVHVEKNGPLRCNWRWVALRELGHSSFPHIAWRNVCILALNGQDIDITLRPMKGLNWPSCNQHQISLDSGKGIRSMLCATTFVALSRRWFDFFEIVIFWWCFDVCVPCCSVLPIHPSMHLFVLPQSACIC